MNEIQAVLFECHLLAAEAKTNGWLSNLAVIEMQIDWLLDQWLKGAPA